jgi:N6-adenosine-specific RNA methylase IME4
MTDPPWEIHQDLPYGTMSDHELLNMGVAQLQDDGVIFMWVTGEAPQTFPCCSFVKYISYGNMSCSTWGSRSCRTTA